MISRFNRRQIETIKAFWWKKKSFENTREREIRIKLGEAMCFVHDNNRMHSSKELTKSVWIFIFVRSFFPSEQTFVCVISMNESRT